MANAISVIYPYKYEGMWVFDDERVGLDREPFVEGADKMIDRVLSLKGLENPDKGFRLIFSEGEFPRYDFRFDWVRESEGGNWYRLDDFQMEGWLCPALLKYFDKAPKHIYARFEKKIITSASIEYSSSTCETETWSGDALNDQVLIRSSI